jgi:hypothetical protein
MIFICRSERATGPSGYAFRSSPALLSRGTEHLVKHGREPGGNGHGPCNRKMVYRALPATTTIISPKQQYIRIMQDPALRTRKIFIYSIFVVICILALLFIFFYVSSRCSKILFGDFGTSNCLIGISVFWLEGGFLTVALFSLYRVNRLMQGKG